ncbi:MAG: hypothetical protein CTY25_12750 [Methylobacterium sp.]|nr:MAG: hypothetical protein CTY25_12750 [Methylobacterium sp.]
MMYFEIFESNFETHLIGPEATLLHLLWTMAKGDRAMPDEADLPAGRMEYLRDDLMILKPIGDDDWLYEHYGKRIAHHSEFDMTGRKVSDFQGEIRDFFVKVYGQVCRELRPLATVHRMGSFLERPLWERVILPVGENGKLSRLYVVNTIREQEKEIGHLFARARGRGLFFLQFLRDEQDRIVDAQIIGANALARQMTNLRYDELTTTTALTVFPHLRDLGIWDRYVEVGTTRVPVDLVVDYHEDGVDGRFEVTVSPYLDGVIVDFQRLPPEGPLSSSEG